MISPQLASTSLWPRGNGCPYLVVVLLTQGRFRMGTAEASEKIKQAVNGHSFSHRIDDTRDNKDPLTHSKIGKVGVEYLLDDARLNAVGVSVSETADAGLLNKTYVISVRAKIEGAKYKEKHFRGVGSEYHTENEQDPTAELEFTYRLDSQGLRPLDVRVIAQSGRGRSLEQLRDGGSARVLERIKTVI